MDNKKTTISKKTLENALKKPKSSKQQIIDGIGNLLTIIANCFKRK